MQINNPKVNFEYSWIFSHKMAWNGTKWHKAVLATDSYLFSIHSFICISVKESSGLDQKIFRNQKLEETIYLWFKPLGYLKVIKVNKNKILKFISTQENYFGIIALNIFESSSARNDCCSVSIIVSCIHLNFVYMF